jgi:sulfite exporter TauE/SafE
VGLPVWRRVEPVARKFLPARSLHGAFVLGGLWGFMPCGLVYTALALSLGNTSALGGAATMGAFGLGTLPTLLTMGAFASRLSSITRIAWVRRAAGAIVIVFGLLHASGAIAAMVAPTSPDHACCANAGH